MERIKLTPLAKQVLDTITRQSRIYPIRNEWHQWKSTPSFIGKLLNIERDDVKIAVNELIDKGIVETDYEETVTDKGKFFLTLFRIDYAKAENTYSEGGQFNANQSLADMFATLQANLMAHIDRRFEELKEWHCQGIDDALNSMAADTAYQRENQAQQYGNCTSDTLLASGALNPDTFCPPSNQQ